MSLSVQEESATKQTEIEAQTFKLITSSGDPNPNAVNAGVVAKPEDVIPEAEKATAKVTSTLILNSMVFKSLDGGVVPSFLCPKCRRNYLPKLDLGDKFAESFDFNGQITIGIPPHKDPESGLPCEHGGQYISLFLAVHQEADQPVQVCIQRSDAEGAGGIGKDWYRPELEASVK